MIDKILNEMNELDSKRLSRFEYLKKLIISAMLIFPFSFILVLHFILMEKSYYSHAVELSLTVGLIAYFVYLIARVYYFAYARLNDALSLPKPVIYFLLLVVMILPYFSGLLILLVLPSKGKVE